MTASLGIYLISVCITIVLGLRAVFQIGRQCPPPADPYFHPFGDMPGFSREELEFIARRPVELHHQSTSAVTATPVGQGSGSVVFLSDAAAAYHRRHLRG